MIANSPKSMLITTALSGMIAYSNNPVLQEDTMGIVHATAIGLGATFISQATLAYASVTFAPPLLVASPRTPTQLFTKGCALMAIGMGAWLGGLVLGHQVTEREVLKNLKQNKELVIPAKAETLGYHNTPLISLTP